MEYDERLGVPLRWWVQATMMVVSVWLATIVALPEKAAWFVTVLVAALIAAFFWSYGGARVRVADGTFRAGRAHIDVRHLGAATALDQEGTRRQAGVDADARAYLLLRPYLKRSVRVDLTDPADPTPYWLVSTRHPEALAAALADATGRVAERHVSQED
ncbi:MAG: DUF3093 domain-containing protein [Nocardioidaceae bacterium]